MSDNYQTNFTELYPHTVNAESRLRKARTMLAILKDYLGEDLTQLKVLNVGCSTAIIDKYLAQHVAEAYAMDIDQNAINLAKQGTVPSNLHLLTGNAQELPFPDSEFDIVICSHVYEHVPNDEALMQEIQRVMNPSGICYFAAGNRLNYREPHHNLPLLSVIPRPLAHLYMRLSGNGDFYYEKHRSYWGLIKLTGYFNRIDYTAKIVNNPKIFYTEYMLQPGTSKHSVAKFITNYIMWLVPSYIWLLGKPPIKKGEQA